MRQVKRSFHASELVREVCPGADEDQLKAQKNNLMVTDKFGLIKGVVEVKMSEEEKVEMDGMMGQEGIQEERFTEVFAAIDETEDKDVSPMSRKQGNPNFPEKSAVMCKRTKTMTGMAVGSLHISGSEKTADSSDKKEET